MEVYHSDNSGNRVPPHPNMSDPVAASGQTLYDATAGGDHTVTVVAGAIYAVTSPVSNGLILGIADITVAANIIWICGRYGTIVIKIPIGVTALHYSSISNDQTSYLRRLA